MNKKICLLFLSFFLFSACVTKHDFQNVVTYSEGRQKASSSDLKFDIQFHNVRKDRSKGVDILEFTMQVENKGFSPIYFQPREYVLVDDEGLRIKPSTVSPGGDLCIWPNQKTVQLSIAYHMPANYQLSRIGSFRVFWNYRIHSNLHRRISKFLRYNIKYRYRKVYPHYSEYPYYCHRDHFYRKDFYRHSLSRYDFRRDR